MRRKTSARSLANDARRSAEEASAEPSGDGERCSALLEFPSLGGDTVGFGWSLRNALMATFRFRTPPWMLPRAVFPFSYRSYARSARKTRRKLSTTATPRWPSRLNVRSHSSALATFSPHATTFAAFARSPTSAARTTCGTTFGTTVSATAKISKKNAKGHRGRSLGAPPRTTRLGPRKPLCADRRDALPEPPASLVLRRARRASASSPELWPRPNAPRRTLPKVSV